MATLSESEASGQFTAWPEVISTLIAKRDLEPATAEAVMSSILQGQATDAQIGAFLASLRAKGETTPEVLGFRRAMFAASVPLELPEGAVDIVGVGGAPRRQVAAFNVSTISSVVASAAGATICKHGNRRASSTSGSFDLLEALGAAIELPAERIEQGVASLGLGFAFARAHHPAMRHVGPARAQLGVPTIFNVLGPLAHPGRIRRQILGVPDAARAQQVADVVAGTDAEHVWVVHGHGDLDELTTAGPSQVIEVRDGHQHAFSVDPADLGFAAVTAEQIRGGDAAVNAEISHELLGGAPSANRDIVVLNAAAALVVAQVAADLAEGVERVSAAIDGGAAAAKLADFVAFSNA